MQGNLSELFPVFFVQTHVVGVTREMWRTALTVAEIVVRKSHGPREIGWEYHVVRWRTRIGLGPNAGHESAFATPPRRETHDDVLGRKVLPIRLHGSAGRQKIREGLTQWISVWVATVSPKYIHPLLGSLCPFLLGKPP